MTETEKLQKAVHLTITAGYQLDKEAFEFLRMLSSTDDPSEIVSKAIDKISGLEDKPLFIGKSFLEQLLQKQEPTNETFAHVPQPIVSPLSEVQTSQQATEAKASFHPYAKEVESHISIIEDPSTKLGSTGSIQEYLGYFRDRFERLEKLLRQRMDVKAAASVIDALKAPSNSKLKIIGMITEKRESKQRTILTVEDLEASMTVLVPQNATEEVQRKAHALMLDQVVCLSVTKTRSTLLIAEDIILPDVAQKPQHKASEPVYAVLTSDMHVGSTKFQREAFNHFVMWLNGKYGDDKMREIASHVKYVIIAGDIVDGVGIYPNQVKELAIKDVYKQYRFAARYIEQIPDYIEVIISPGNHDTPRKSLPQPAISDAFLETLRESRNVHSVGDPCYLSLDGVEILVYHGRSLDDVISTIPGMSNNQPEKAMKLLLQSRHLAPMYGGKTMLSAENKDFLVIERVPDIFHAGHIHAVGHCTYRGVLIVNSGGWQDQTSYMQRLGFMPTPGKVPIVNLQTLEVTVMPFT
ncbi:MAG TPA: DNA-directed DNA polymerase II small subunit [Candidatus Acidoferrum sp.]|jgi:DNA polymerase II small subunit|nr:DNA-directed DNA polymerase II small subunit [Candidatus Acidoferrum sp.]